MNRWHAWRAARARPASAFVSQPEPRTIGSFAKGRQLIAGNFLFAGSLIEDPKNSIWRLPPQDRAFDDEIHGFAWLDDLAAVGDLAARQRAQAWLEDWIRLYGRGAGPGWTPDLTGRRLIRWINHAIFLLNGRDSSYSRAYYASLAQQTIFLSRRCHSASPGLPRFEALTGLIHAGISLEGMEHRVSPAMKGLSKECAEQIDEEGGIPTRNPEELLTVFTLLNWAASALAQSGRMASREHLMAIERIAPTLRALRHADGGLARFHGGGRGAEGRLDHALASSGVKSGPAQGLCMGFARLHGADKPDRRCKLSADRDQFLQRACFDPGLRTHLGPQAADRQLRVRRQFRRGLAARGTGDAVAFHAGDRGVFLLSPRSAPDRRRGRARGSCRYAEGCPGAVPDRG